MRKKEKNWLLDLIDRYPTVLTDGAFDQLKSVLEIEEELHLWDQADD